MCIYLGSSFSQLYAFWTWLSVSFLRVGKFSAIISKNKCSTILGRRYLSEPLLYEYWYTWYCPRDPLSYLLLLSFFFPFWCSYWLISIPLSSKLLIRSSLSSNLLKIPCSVFFIQLLYIFFISDWCFLYFLSLCWSYHCFPPFFSWFWWVSLWPLIWTLFHHFILFFIISLGLIFRAFISFFHCEHILYLLILFDILCLFLWIRKNS